jgi:DNA-binding MarR family transcriptional regulator
MALAQRHATVNELSPEVYRAEAELRAALRQFQRRSEVVARKHGLTPQQYALLLQIKGDPNRRERTTVGELAARLQLNQSTITELVQRAERAGLVQRTVSPDDARSYWLTLTPDGDRRLAAIVARLGTEGRELAHLLRSVAAP